MTFVLDWGIVNSNNNKQLVYWFGLIRIILNRTIILIIDFGWISVFFAHP